MQVKKYVATDLAAHVRVAGRKVKPGQEIALTPTQAEWELSRRVIAEAPSKPASAPRAPQRGATGKASSGAADE